MGKAMQAPELANMLASFQTNAPQLQVDIDRVKAKSQGVSLTEVFDTLQVNLGSLYVNDFNRFGRTYRVMAADAQFRMQAEDRHAQGAQCSGRHDPAERSRPSSAVPAPTG